MGGTTPVAKYVKTDYTGQTATAYKTNIDANSVVGMRFADNFAPRAQDTPVMTVHVDAGHLFDGTTLSEIAAQNTGTLSAPSSHDRIDRIVIDNTTGTISVVAGTEAVSPSPPAVPSGKSPIAQVLLHTSTTSITNALITDERDFSALNIGGYGTQTNLASASTCDLGTVATHNIKITGTTTITAFGSSANTIAPNYLIEFGGALTLTHDGTALILPGAQNIKTAAGDTAEAEYLGSGNWRVRQYQRTSGQTVSMTGPETSIASASTTDLGSKGVNALLVSGTTGITSFGSSASTANPVYFVRFSGALTITHDGTALILPGAANISTAAGDSLTALYLGSGNWRVLAYNVAANGILFGRQFLQIQDQKSQNTAGGTFNSGAWQTRDLTTKVTDEIGSTLSGNQFTLPAGKYVIDATAPAFNINAHQGKLYNVTDTADVILGTPAFSANGAFADSRTHVAGQFTIAGTKTFEIRHQCSLSHSTNGFGSPGNFTTEIYTDVRITRVA